MFLRFDNETMRHPKVFGYENARVTVSVANTELVKEASKNFEERDDIEWEN